MTVPGPFVEETMKSAITRTLLLPFVVALMAMSAHAQTNSTLGYGNGQLLKFLYTQTFSCIDQPKDDLNFNGIPAS